MLETRIESGEALPLVGIPGECLSAGSPMLAKEGDVPLYWWQLLLPHIPDKSKVVVLESARFSKCFKVGDIVRVGDALEATIWKNFPLIFLKFSSAAECLRGLEDWLVGGG
jgi:hypothetical protein